MHIDTHDKSPKELCFELENLIQKEHRVVDPILIGDLSHIHNRAESYNGITVEAVDYDDGSTFTLSYSYEWNVYNGCGDMDENDEVHDCISFYIDEDGQLIFDAVRPEPRTSLEEF